LTGVTEFFYCKEQYVVLCVNLISASSGVICMATAFKNIETKWSQLIIKICMENIIKSTIVDFELVIIRVIRGENSLFLDTSFKCGCPD
jgi:hypothetical protein